MELELELDGGGAHTLTSALLDRGLDELAML